MKNLNTPMHLNDWFNSKSVIKRIWPGQRTSVYRVFENVYFHNNPAPEPVFGIKSEFPTEIDIKVRNELYNREPERVVDLDINNACAGSCGDCKYDCHPANRTLYPDRMHVCSDSAGEHIAREIDDEVMGEYVNGRLEEPESLYNKGTFVSVRDRYFELVNDWSNIASKCLLQVNSGGESICWSFGCGHWFNKCVCKFENCPRIHIDKK